MRSQFLAIAGSIAISVWFVPKADAQIPFLPNLLPAASSSNDSESKVSDWVYLDGRRVFQIAGTRANITERLENIQEKLLQISQDYFASPSKEVKVESRTLKGLPVIYVNDQYLMTINSQDAKLRQVDDPSDAANQIAQILQERLKRAKQERQTSSLVHHGAIAAGTGLTMIVISWAVYGWQRRSTRPSVQPLQRISADTPLTTQLKRQQHTNLKEVKRRLFQLAQFSIWAGGTLFIMGLFPYTRSLQLGVFPRFAISFASGCCCIGNLCIYPFQLCPH